MQRREGRRGLNAKARREAWSQCKGRDKRGVVSVPR